MAGYQETAAVLARWREIERQLEQVMEGSPEAEHLQSEAARLRDEIRRLTTPAARAEGLAEGLAEA